MPTVYLDKTSKFYQTNIWIDGRKFSRSTKRTSKREAQARAAELERDLREQYAAETAAGDSLTLDAVAERYMRDVGDSHAGKDNTERLCAYILEHFGPVKLVTEITHDDVAGLIRWRRKHRVGKGKHAPLISAYTVNDTTEQLKKLFTYLKKRGVRFVREPDWRDPALWLKEPAARERELSDDETARLGVAMATVRPDYAPLFEFAWTTGKRLTECRTLRWSHVKWDQGLIERPGKGGRIVRVKISPTIRAIIKPLLGQHDTFVFTFVGQRTSNGKAEGQRYPITRDGLRRVWSAVREAAAIPTRGENRFRFHDLRHDFATKLMRTVDNASGLKVVQRALDHASIVTTMRYTHVLDDDVADDIEAVAAARGDKIRDTNHPKNHPSRALKIIK